MPILLSCAWPQVALDAERAKRKVGRTFLGDLEKSVLGKGKMQAVSLRPKSFLTGAWVPSLSLPDAAGGIEGYGCVFALKKPKKIGSRCPREVYPRQ